MVPPAVAAAQAAAHSIDERDARRRAAVAQMVQPLFLQFYGEPLVNKLLLGCVEEIAKNVAGGATYKPPELAQAIHDWFVEEAPGVLAGFIAEAK